MRLEGCGAVQRAHLAIAERRPEGLARDGRVCAGTVPARGTARHPATRGGSARRPSAFFTKCSIRSRLRAARDDDGARVVYKIPLESRHQPPRGLLVETSACALRILRRRVVGIRSSSSKIFRPACSSRSSSRYSRRWKSRGLSPPASRTKSTRRWPGHLELHEEDCCSKVESEDPRTGKLPCSRKIRASDFPAAKLVKNGLLNLARTAQVDSGTCDINTGDQRRAVAARASVQERPASRSGRSWRRAAGGRASKHKSSRSSQTCSSTPAMRCRRGRV